MIGLGALVVEHFDALEADFVRFYGLELPAILWGPEPVSYRRLSVLVHGIPVDSAFGVSTGAMRPGWGNTEELLATLAEVVDAGNRSFFRVHSKRGAQQPKPIKITRPADPHAAPRKRRKATSEELVGIFGNVARYTGPPSAGEGTGVPDPVDELVNLDAQTEPVPDPPEEHP